MTPEDQVIVRQAAKDSVPVMRNLGVAQEKVSEDNVVAAGAQVVRDIDMQPFIDAMKPIYAKSFTSDVLKHMAAKIPVTE